jgi:DNA-binding NarL/FixJ family response regulator
MNTISVILADDHPMIRSGIRMLLKEADDISIVGEASNGEEAVTLTRDLTPDIIVLDLSMPKLSGIEAVRIITRRYPKTRILVLTMHENEEYILQIVKSGASGYIIKTSGKDELLKAIRTVAAGEKYFSHRVSEILVEGFIRKSDTGEEPNADKAGPLTRREKEILALVAQGLTNQEIGKKLFISHRTVDTHRTNIMQKLDIHDVANLVRYAVQHGIVSPDTEPGE